MQSCKDIQRSVTGALVVANARSGTGTGLYLGTPPLAAFVSCANVEKPHKTAAKKIPIRFIEPEEWAIRFDSSNKPL
jgi:hypothetical protein